MRPTPHVQHRQLWELNTQAASSTTTSASCTPFTLPSNGILSFAPDNIVTLTADILFQPDCDVVYNPVNSDNDTTALNDPFYASSAPQVYVISAATVLGWVLVVMLIISPRTFFGGGVSSSAFGGRGVIGGASGGTTSLVGVGSRPWLQKAAALTVAIALTIATADTFKVSKAHYPVGIDGNSLREVVENSLEIRITRTISDIFVWLAQVQTLIRLFPRHKEKVLIKWIGFALIVLDTTFSCLNSFLGDHYRRPRDFVDAIPALGYLFELALGLLYAAWVIFYSITKRRYAFYHPKMKNICVLALLSLVSILTPVVFFVTDVTLPDVAGWGDYFRWVGAAAASVVVWEWVERIEALERDEKKDGILGREIFDGDEMLDMNPSSDMTYVPRRNDRYVPKGWFDRNSNGSTSGSGSDRPSLAALAKRLPRPNRRHHGRQATVGLEASDIPSSEQLQAVTAPRCEIQSSGPSFAEAAGVAGPEIVQPPSRTETTSAASTVYVVRHDGGREPPQPIRRRVDLTPEPLAEAREDDQRQTEQTQPDDGQPPPTRSTAHWHTAINPFKRKRTNTPAEVRAAIRASVDDPRPPINPDPKEVEPSAVRGSRWQFKNRIRALATHRETGSDGPAAIQSTTELPWTIVPAPTRGAMTWSPGVPIDVVETSSPRPEARTAFPAVDLGSEDQIRDPR